MRDFVGDHVAPRLRRSEHQPPAVADPPGAAATAPARGCVPDADRSRLDRGAALQFPLSPATAVPAPAALRYFSILPGKAASAPPAVNSPASSTGARGPAGDQRKRTSSPSIGIIAPSTNGSAGCAWLICDRTHSPCSAAQAERRSSRQAARVGQLEQLALFVEPEPHPPRGPDRARQYRNGKVGVMLDPARAARSTM